MRTDWPQRDAFVRYLEEQRTRRGYSTWHALAEAAGISHSTLSSWRTGRQKPTLDNLIKVAEALGVPGRELAKAAGTVDLERIGFIAPEPDKNDEHYRDPATGVVYVDETERQIWDLTDLGVETRRRLIHFVRAEREAEAQQQQRAG